MEEVKNNILKILKSKYFVFIITTILSIIMFWQFYNHMAIDTYRIATGGYYNYAMQFSFDDGRIFNGLIYLIFSIFNLSIYSYVNITLTLAIIVSCFTIIKLKEIIEKYKKINNIYQKIILYIISFVTIFNFMYLDCLYFADCFSMALSILLYLISADIIVENKKLALLKGILISIVGTLMYQASICMLITFLALFSVIKNGSNYKKICIDFLKAFAVIFTSAIFDYVLMKIFNFNTNRVDFDIINNIANIMYIFPLKLISTDNLFPKNLFIILFNLLSALIILSLVKDKKENNLLYSTLILIAVTMLSGFGMNIIVSTSFEARTKISMGAAIGILYLFIYAKTDFLERKSNKKLIFITALIIYASINVINYEYMIMQNKQLIELDKQTISEIENSIDNYEKVNNIKVNRIVKVKYMNQKGKQYYKSTRNKSCYTSSAIRSSAYSADAINFYTNRNYESCQILASSQEAIEYVNLEGNYKGYACIGDALYVSVY